MKNRKSILIALPLVLAMLFVSYTVSAALAIVCYLFIYRQTVKRLEIMLSKPEAVNT